MRHVQKCNVGSSWPRTVGGTLHRCPLQSNCNSGLGARSKSDPWTDRPEPGHKCKQVMTPSSTTQSYVLFKYIYNFLEWRLSDFDRILLVLLQIFFFCSLRKKKKLPEGTRIHIFYKTLPVTQILNHDHEVPCGSKENQTKNPSYGRDQLWQKIWPGESFMSTAAVSEVILEEGAR